MILEGDSDIIQQCQWHGDKGLQYLTFRNGSVLVISENALAFYKNEAAIYDPLGNGLLEMAELAEPLVFGDQGFVTEYRAGFVGLANEMAILITPNDIQLFPNKESALRNQNEIARLKLS